MELFAQNILKEISNEYLRIARESAPYAVAATLIKANNDQIESWLELKEILDFDIFLSHAFKDADIVAGIMVELTKLGYLVYVDWIFDPQISRKTVNEKTARILRKRMAQSKCLLYATTKNAPHSKWMPWELGFKDGQNGKCAILPVKETFSSPNSFKGQEYLGIYKKVVMEKHLRKLWVCPEAMSASKKCILFDTWAGSTPLKKQTLNRLSIIL